MSISHTALKELHRSQTHSMSPLMDQSGLRSPTGRVAAGGVTGADFSMVDQPGEPLTASPILK